MRAEAFCPGHVTGFFETFHTADLLSTGSRGAGMCLSLGASSAVEAVESNRRIIDVTINEQRSEAEVTKTAIDDLLEDRALKVSVDTTLQLPVSQGFGMSAAGALSASLALAEILGDSRQRAFEAAHKAEVLNKCGLGDVSALHRGGITVRKRPGLPPVGEVLRIDGTPEVVLCVIGKGRPTRDVIGDSKMQGEINTYGGRCVEILLRKPTVDNLMKLSRAFAVDSGLATRQILPVVEAASKVGAASMAMLGNAVFALGDSKGLKDALSGFGRVFSCTVDVGGPRILTRKE